jgi:hypothetical protein
MPEIMQTSTVQCGSFAPFSRVEQEPSRQFKFIEPPKPKLDVGYKLEQGKENSDFQTG